MPKKLKLLLESQRLRLATKSLVFAFLLFLSPGSFLFSALTVIAAFYFYFSPPINYDRYLFSFLIIIIVALTAVGTNQYLSLSYLLPAVFGGLFFILLGVKKLVFINRQALYSLFNGILLFIIFDIFFAADKSQGFLMKYLLLFAAVFLLFRELLRNFTPDFPKRRNLVASGVAFLVAELAWAIALLPIGFLNSTALMMLFALELQDFVINHFSGTLKRDLILKNVTVLIILSLVIFAASRWSL